MAEPLAERLRPQVLQDIIGQEHLTGEAGTLAKILKSRNLPSMLFWGPPGTGKTTLALILAKEAGIAFKSLSAISSGVKDIREVIQHAKARGRLVLFIDEIHRFNKSQQDALLEAVERGYIVLIGATTENPSFEVNAALLSRCQVYTLKALDKSGLERLIARALEKDSFLSKYNVELKESAALLRLSGGDGRKLLNLLEVVVNYLHEEGKDIEITNDAVAAIAQQRPSIYDKDGEQHYDIISAFIKSIRGSDPNAAVYWLARMIEGGEDLKFIARRLVIAASEDIGLANPTALIMANNTFQAVNVVGYPEAEIILSQCVIYLTTSPKSNASYRAIKDARQLVKQTGDLGVPLHLRNASTQLMKQMGYGKNYQYAHDFPGNFVPQEYMPDELRSRVLYQPGANAKERQYQDMLRQQWKKYDY
ncbi:MAG: replication-associated recombination protein A [Cyclobacteriaceae bacterium]|nr:replication-associated recombination protein A [Cyclobacteriaceae bacterium]MCH8516796.1 replication-associated recombination protein A [Cyclobacteriaceae bacterium]